MFRREYKNHLREFYEAEIQFQIHRLHYANKLIALSYFMCTIYSRFVKINDFQTHADACIFE